MKSKTLNELFLDQLADIYDAEKRIVKALPKMAKAATCNDLKAAFESHLQETQGHVTKLEQVFQCFETEAKGKTCEATKGLLAEGEEIAADFQNSPAINAALICAAQKVEHYELATYGCLHAWAGVLGNTEAADILEEILDDEKTANSALTDLAESKNTQEALGDSSTPDKDDETRTPLNKKSLKSGVTGRPVAPGVR